MTYVTLTCPECGAARVYNGRGRCTCGAYLVSHWSGMHHGVRLVMPAHPIWFLSPDGWQRIPDDVSPSAHVTVEAALFPDTTTPPAADEGE